MIAFAKRLQLINPCLQPIDKTVCSRKELTDCMCILMKTISLNLWLKPLQDGTLLMTKCLKTRPGNLDAYAEYKKCTNFLYCQSA